VGMDGMSAAEEDSVFEVDEMDEEDEDGETYFRTEHVSRTEELQEVVDMAAKEVSMLCELLGLSAKESSISNRSLLERITHLKAAVSVLLDSSKEKVDALTSNGDLEDVEIVHSRTNGNSVLTTDLTAVEVLEVELNETRNKLEEREGELKDTLVKVKSQEVEVDRLTSLLDITTTKLAAAEEENKLMSEDLERKNENEDEQIRRDMNIRNEAVKEKNTAWIELSQTKEGRAVADEPSAHGSDSTKGGAWSAAGTVAARHATAGRSEIAGKPESLFQVNAVETFWSGGLVLLPVFLYWMNFID